MNEVRATSIFDVLEIKFFHQLAQMRSFQELLAREASVDKCIK